MNHPLLGLSIILTSFMPVVLQADVDSCDAISCDCTSIGNPQWQRQCQKQEQKLRNICTENNNKPRNYCGIHGYDANRVALATRNRQLQSLSQAEIKPSLKVVETQDWSAANDIETAEQARAEGNFSAAEIMHKSAEKTRMRMFKTRKRVAATWRSLGEEGEAEEVWDNAAGSIRKSAREMKKITDQLWATYAELRGDSPEKKALGSLMNRVLKNTGNEFERAAYAFERAREAENAAAMWSDAAEISERLATYKREAGQRQAVINYYRHQAATRWYRAALSWSTDEEFEQAETVYNQAEKIAKSK